MNGGRVAWLNPDDPPDAFPDISNALREPDGLLAAGGDLSEDRLLAAYAHGIFPWYDDGQPILWWSPDPRCVLRPEAFHVSRRLRRDARQAQMKIRYNSAFETVVDECAEPRPGQSGTWITSEMKAAYADLHSAGWAHSVETWLDGRLVGGMYGVGIGSVFFGESMFSRVDNASKFAMLALSIELVRRGVELIDCQVASPHLFTVGAEMMPRQRVRAVLDRCCSPAKRFAAWPDAEFPLSSCVAY